jgi:hypothetical protein
VSKGRNAMAIWHDLFDDHQFEVAADSLLHYVNEIFKEGK